MELVPDIVICIFDILAMGGHISSAKSLRATTKWANAFTAYDIYVLGHALTWRRKQNRTIVRNNTRLACKTLWLEHALEQLCPMNPLVRYYFVLEQFTIVPKWLARTHIDDKKYVDELTEGISRMEQSTEWIFYCCFDK